MEKEIMLGDKLFKIIETSEKSKKLINEDGLIFIQSKNDVKLVKGSKTKNGYLLINTGDKLEYVHRLVYRLFRGEIPKDMEINHIDGNKQNNKIDNLELVTRQENLREPIRCERMKIAKQKPCYIIINGEKIQKDSRTELNKYVHDNYGVRINVTVPMKYRENNYMSEVVYL